MSKKTQAADRTLTVAEAAAEMGVTTKTVIGWARKGQLAIIVPPGRTLEDGKSGQKTLRIERADWEAFLRTCKDRGAAASAAPAPAAREKSQPVPVESAAGTDGISRRGKKKR